MSNKTPEELAEEVFRLNKNDIKSFLIELSLKYKSYGINSAKFNVACYLSIASRWIE